MNFIWIILLLLCCNNGSNQGGRRNDFDCDRGCDNDCHRDNGLPHEDHYDCHRGFEAPCGAICEASYEPIMEQRNELMSEQQPTYELRRESAANGMAPVDPQQWQRCNQ